MIDSTPERPYDFLVVKVEIWRHGNDRKRQELVTLVTQNVTAAEDSRNRLEGPATYVMSVRKAGEEIGMLDIEGHTRGAGALVLAWRALEKLVKR